MDVPSYTHYLDLHSMKEINMPTKSLKTVPLLDHEYCALTVHEQNKYLKSILSSLLNSTSLANEGEIATEDFNSYSWVPKENVDLNLFNEFLADGIESNLEEGELDGFLYMVSDIGARPTYYFIRKAREALQLQDAEKLPEILADFEIQDWKIGCESDVPREHQDIYRFVVQKSARQNQVHFQLYSKELDGVSDEVTLNGLSGLIEVRNGKPAMSIGLEENNLCIHLESDIYSGVHIHADSSVSPYSTVWKSHSHGMYFPTLYSSCADEFWLLRARTAIADKFFQNYDLPDKLVIAESNGWQIAGDCWKQCVFFECPAGGDTIKGLVEINFAENSTVIAYSSVG
jgi:hypothetical protein